MTVRELSFQYSTQGAAAAARADERVRKSVQRTGRAAQRSGAAVQRWMERNRKSIRAVGLAAGTAVGSILAASPTMRAQLGGVRSAFTLFADTIVRDVLPAGNSLGSMVLDLAQRYRDLPDPLRGAISTVLAFVGAALAILPAAAALIKSVLTVASAISGFAASVGGAATSIPILSKAIGSLVTIGGLLITALKGIAVAIAGFIGGLSATAVAIAAVVVAVVAFAVALITNFRGARDKTLRFLRAIWQRGTALFNLLAESLIAIVSRIAEVLAVKWIEIKNRIITLLTILRNAAIARILETRKRILKLLSLSRELATKGRDMIGGLLQGVRDRAGEVVTAFGSMARDAAQRFIDMFNAVIPDSIPIPSRTFSIPDILGGGSVTVGGGSLDIPNIVPQLETGGRIAREGLAMLHEGERVVPAAQVRERGRQPVGGGDTRIERMIVQVGPRDDPRRQGQEIAAEFEKQLENRGQ